MKNKLGAALLYLLVAAIPIIFVLFLIYWDVRQSSIENKLGDLVTINDLKAQIISDYFNSIEAQTIAHNYANIKIDLPILSHYSENTSSTEYIQAKKTLDAQLPTWIAPGNGIVDIMLVNTSGTIVYTANNNTQEIGKSLPDPENLAFSKGTKDIYTSDIFINKERNNLLTFFISSPVYDSQNNFVGVSAFEIDASNLYKLIENTSGLGKTGETLIGEIKYANGIPDHVLMLNPLRKDPGAAFQRQIPVGAKSAQPIQNATLGETGYGIVPDYAGNEVLAAWQYLPDQKWGLVTKIDLSEGIGQVNTLGLILIVLSLCVAIFAATTIFLLSKRSYDQFKLAVDNSSEQTSITDPEGKILYINQITEKITGYTINEIIGTKAGKLWSLPMPPEFYQNLWKIIKIDKKQFVGEIRNRRKNGEVYDAELKISPVLDKSNNIVFFVEIERDISLEKKLSETKNEVIAKDEAIFASIGDGLVVTDKEGKIVLVNQAFEQLTGWKKDESIGRLFADIIPREDESGNKVPFDERILQKVLEGKVVFTAATTTPTQSAVAVPPSYFIKKDGTKFPVVAIVSPIYIDGMIIGTVEVFRDISKEKEIDKIKSEFMSLASHQLRTPPSIIGWYAEVLQSGDLGPLNEKQSDYVKEIYKANQRMIAIINSLLNVSRIEAGTFSISPKNIEIKEIIDETVKELESRFNRTTELKKEYDPSLSAFQADPNIFQIIIDNLLSNAFKYTPPQNTKIEVAAKMEDDSLVLSVKDNGVGIPLKDRDRVFEKLFRADNAVSANPDGTGLGLYMIKKIIVNGLGGKIWFDSEEGKGSTFYVSIPSSGMKEKTGTTVLTRTIVR